MKITPKPKRRGRFRLAVGSCYFTLKRYFLWIFGGLKFAQLSETTLPHLCISHKTPLIRKLKDVDMYLQHNKITNLKIAAAKLNGAVIRPGETLSYWKLTGKPTRRKGYLKGMVLRSGGLCQMSNLIYWMTIHTPLTVTERHRHGYDVFTDSNRTQPFGSGASCYYNYCDLMIRNETTAVYRLTVEVTETHLVGVWTSDRVPQYRYEVYEKEHLMRSEYWGGYTRHNLIYRRKFDEENREIADEYVTENHAIMMYTPFLADAEIK